MSEIRASRKPFSSKISFAADNRRARVRAPLLKRGPLGRSAGISAASQDNSPCLVFPLLSAGGGVDAEKPREVAAHELPDGLLRELLNQLVDRRLRVGQALRVRPVGAEQHVVLTEQIR